MIEIMTTKYIDINDNVYHPPYREEDYDDLCNITCNITKLCNRIHKLCDTICCKIICCEDNQKEIPDI